MVSMNRRSREDRTRIIAALVEGNSIRGVSRMTGFSKNTITKLLFDLTGTQRLADEYHDVEEVKNDSLNGPSKSD